LQPIFAIGLASFFTPFQSVTKRSCFADATANIISRLLCYEGLIVFVLKAAFSKCCTWGGAWAALGSFSPQPRFWFEIVGGPEELNFLSSRVILPNGAAFRSNTLIWNLSFR